MLPFDIMISLISKLVHVKVLRKKKKTQKEEEEKSHLSSCFW